MSHQFSRWKPFQVSAIALLLWWVGPVAPLLAARSSPLDRAPNLDARVSQVNFGDLEDFEYWQRLCRLQTAAAEYEDAQQACERAIEIRLEDASIWADHSGVLLQLEQYPEAIASADLSLTYNLENSLAFTYQCIAFHALENYDIALDKCNEALRLNGDWGNESPALAWRYRGQILDQQGESELALVAYERTLLLSPDNSLVLTYQCQALLNLKRYEAALVACQQALNADQQWEPETPALARFYQGLAHSALGQYEAAIRVYDQAIAIDPERADVWTQQGWALERLNRPTEALTSYTRAVELAPESSQALVGQCTAFNQVEQYDMALAACQQAIQGDGVWWPVGAAQAWSEQAQALAGTGMLAEALAASNRAVGIHPDYSEAHRNRSVILWYLGVQQETPEQALADFVQAAEAAAAAIALDPEAARAWANLGRILRSQGQLLAAYGNQAQAGIAYQEALTAYQEAIALDGNDAGVWSNYSVVLWTLGQYDDALNAADEAIGIDAASAQAWQNQGAALVALGRYVAAQASYEQAVRLDEQNATAWASLGIVQLRLNQPDAGMASLEKAIELDPEHPLANRALEQLSQAESSR